MDENPYRAPQATDNRPTTMRRLIQTMAKTAVAAYLALCVGVGLWVCPLYFALGLWR
jgi:hypothetical protein